MNGIEISDKSVKILMLVYTLVHVVHFVVCNGTITTPVDQCASQDTVKVYQSIFYILFHKLKLFIPVNYNKFLISI